MPDRHHEKARTSLKIIETVWRSAGLEQSLVVSSYPESRINELSPEQITQAEGVLKKFYADSSGIYSQFDPNELFYIRSTDLFNNFLTLLELTISELEKILGVDVQILEIFPQFYVDSQAEKQVYVSHVFPPQNLTLTYSEICQVLRLSDFQMVFSSLINVIVQVGNIPSQTRSENRHIAEIFLSFLLNISSSIFDYKIDDQARINLISQAIIKLFNEDLLHDIWQDKHYLQLSDRYFMSKKLEIFTHGDISKFPDEIRAQILTEADIISYFDLQAKAVPTKKVSSNSRRKQKQMESVN